MPPILCFPEGLVRLRVISGTPETFEVKAIVPFAKAEMGLPDGARVTDSVSTTSAYISLDVWRTFGRLHGNAGALLEENGDSIALEGEGEGDFLCFLSAYMPHIL